MESTGLLYYNRTTDVLAELYRNSCMASLFASECIDLSNPDGVYVRSQWCSTIDEHPEKWGWHYIGEV